MSHREPSLAGAGRPGGKRNRMTLQRADVGILGRRACTHPTLAQIDLLKTLARRGGIEVEQRPLRHSESDIAFDIALHQFVAAFEPLVEIFEHTPRLLA